MSSPSSSVAEASTAPWISSPSSSDNGLTEQPRWVPWLLLLLLAVTLAMRVWNGSSGLDARRFFDERFSLRNVEMVLVDGSSRPANAFYGSLSYLPQTAALWTSQKLYELTDNETFNIYKAKPGKRGVDIWSSTAYFIVRLVCAVFGTLSVWLTFLLGKRLFGPRVGLLGAALMAAFPRHILASTEFKPDILVVLLVLLTFLWSLDVVEKPTLRAFLWAGAGVGLAVAAKYTGVGVAIPLTVGVLYGGWRERRTWNWLIGAGAASLITFAILNIHLAVIIEYLPRIWRIMESKGDATGGSRWDVLGIEFAFLVRHHRWPVMIFALLGCAGIIRRAWDRSSERLARVSSIMVLSYIFGYSFLYAAATKLFKGQNYLPVAAFTSLLAAWTILGLWDRGVRLWPWLRAWPVALVLWGGFVTYLFAYPFDIIYHAVVPSTQKQVEQELRRHLRPLELRQVFYEPLERPLNASTPGGHWLVTLPRERLVEETERTLDGSDAEVFPADRLSGEEAQPYLRRATREGVRSLRIEPGLFKAHGPALVVLLHPWALDGEPQKVELEETAPLSYRVAGERPEAWQATSLAMWLPLHTGPKKPKRIFIEGQEIPLYRTRRGGRRAHFITPKFILGPPPTEEATSPTPVEPAAAADEPTEMTDPAAGDLVLTFEEGLRLDQIPEVRVVRWQP